MTWAPLADAASEAVFGGKAAALARAIQAGLPVPPGLALAASFVEAVGAGEPAPTAALARLPIAPGPLAVRSSAVGEDSAAASFAGQHASLLNVRGADALVAAVRAVWRSACSEAAMAYRRRLGVEGAPRMGVVVQRLAVAEVAGVLFTLNPLTGADERVIEAAWGLGQAVVEGRVVPDRYRVSRAGEVLERTPGRMRVAVRALAEGSVAEEPLAPELAGVPCLDDARLLALHRLALACERLWDGAHDLEWAFADGRPVLLQRRPITRLPAAPPTDAAPHEEPVDRATVESLGAPPGPTEASGTP
jgi:pyruvate,water dikinase